MKELVHFAVLSAPVLGAAASRTGMGMGMITTIITTTTRKRGAIG